MFKDAKENGLQIKWETIQFNLENLKTGEEIENIIRSSGYSTDIQKFMRLVALFNTREPFCQLLDDILKFCEVNIYLKEKKYQAFFLSICVDASRFSSFFI